MDISMNEFSKISKYRPLMNADEVALQYILVYVCRESRIDIDKV
jgi:hypothetical protein